MSDEESQDFTSPNQLHPVYDIASSQKGYNFLMCGFNTKFDRKGDLAAFQHDLWIHLVQNTGMDSISYIPDPTDSSCMKNGVKEHSRFTVDSAKKMCEKQLKLYDFHDWPWQQHVSMSIPAYISHSKIS